MMIANEIYKINPTYTRVLEKLELKHNAEITRYVLKHKLDN